jgi:hypothetical protein
MVCSVVGLTMNIIMSLWEHFAFYKNLFLVDWGFHQIILLKNTFVKICNINLSDLI